MIYTSARSYRRKIMSSKDHLLIHYVVANSTIFVSITSLNHLMDGQTIVTTHLRYVDYDEWCESFVYTWALTLTRINLYMLERTSLVHWKKVDMSLKSYKGKKNREGPLNSTENTQFVRFNFKSLYFIHSHETPQRIMIFSNTVLSLVLNSTWW